MELEEKISIDGFQKYVEAMCKKHGWDKSSPTETFLLFTEEVGELAKAIRYKTNLYKESGKDFDVDKELMGEFADVLSYIAHLANHFNISLEDAIKFKEEVNAKRSWD